ncbi:MAG: amidohydrolase family protein [Hyphomonadaceae bacterium]
MKFLLGSLAALAMVLAATPASAQEAAAPVLYRGAVLIDGTGAAARSGAGIVVEGERIIALLADDAAAPEGARVVDVSGLYVLPGLIDTHVHIATPPDNAQARLHLRRWLYSGVTGVRSMADDTRAVAELARQARANEIEAPDIAFAALMAGESFFDDPRTHAAAAGYAPGTAPWMQAITPRTDLRAAVALARGTGAGAIKIYANLPAREVARITREAHRQGIAVWAHTAVYPARPSEVVAAGPDVMSHACSLAHEGQSRADHPQTYSARTPIDPAPFLNADNPAVARVAAEMARRGIILDATVRIYTEQERWRVVEASRRPALCTPELSYAMARQAHEAGVRLSAGTDGETADDAPYPALHEELELLVAHTGLTPLEAIQAATQTAAEAMGAGDEMGVIAPGRLANLVFVGADPSADISALRDVRFTLRRGQRFDRSRYDGTADDQTE